MQRFLVSITILIDLISFSYFAPYAPINAPRENFSEVITSKLPSNGGSVVENPELEV